MELVKLDESHGTDAIALMTQILMNKEPVFSCRKVPFDIAREFNEAIVNRAIRDEVSVVAIDTATNKVVGVMANLLVSGASEVDEVYAKCEPSEWLSPVFVLLEKLKERFYQLEEVRKIMSRERQFMNVSIVVVSDGYHGRGITRQLLEKSTEMGKSKGARMVYSELTSPISQHIFKTTPGFVQVGELIEYREFQSDGVKPFAGMSSDFKGAILCMKRL
ncbi:uncharacterized protein [Ptychodera flava]|uniref:uncharacterized protein n=1 Tax=Ptychodera flava TaxID=63121 RepID=UPI00396A6C08